MSEPTASAAKSDESESDPASELEPELGFERLGFERELELEVSDIGGAETR